MNMPLTEQQKLAAEYEQSANSAVTDWSTIPELVDYSYTLTQTSVSAPAKTLYFDQLVAEYGELKAQIEIREARQDELKSAIQAAVMISGKEKVGCVGYRLNMIHKAGSKKILPELLISQGVTPDQIAKATKVGGASDYLDIRAIKEKG